MSLSFFRVARVRAVRCVVDVVSLVSKYSGYLVIECSYTPVTQCSLAQLRFQVFCTFSLVVPPSVYCFVT